MPPRSLSLNHLRLEEPDHRFREGIVIGVATAADRRLDAGICQTLGVAHRQVLGAPIAVMDQVGDVGATAVVDRLFQGIKDTVGAQRRGHAPADDASRKDIHDEGHIHEAAPRGDVGEIRDPELVGARRGKPTIDQIRIRIDAKRHALDALDNLRRGTDAANGSGKTASDEEIAAIVEVADDLTSQSRHSLLLQGSPPSGKLLIPLSRRDVRVVEGARLESVCRGNSTVGSNPTLSANLIFEFPEDFSRTCENRFLSAKTHPSPGFPVASRRSLAARSLSDISVRHQCDISPPARGGITSWPKMPETSGITLRAFLEDPSRPPETLTYHELQGFLFAVIGELMGLYNSVNAAVFENRAALPVDCQFRPQTLANLEDDAPVAQWSRGFLHGHQWLQESWDAYVPDEIDDDYAAMLMTLSFFASKKLAEAYCGEAGGRELTETAKSIRGVFPEALAGYAHLGRSIQQVVAEAERGEPRQPQRRKIGRNELCSCGSGRKYKRCCGASA